MAKKRTNRLPAGIKRLADGRIRIRVTRVDPVTRRRQDATTTLPAETTTGQALDARDALREELRGARDTPDRAPTLTVYARRWLRRKAGRVRAKTLSTYIGRLERGLLPHLGHVRIDALTRAHVVWWRDQLAEEIGDGEGCVSQATARSRWRDGRILLRDALADYERPDLSARIDPPLGSSTPRREAHTLSREEVTALVDAAAGPYRVLIRFLARTGCRVGEGRGLRWCDVDLDARVAHIRRSITALGGGQGWQTSTPKAKVGRTVGLSADLVEALEAWRKERPGVGEALVWATRGGKPVQTKTLYHAMDRASSAAGIEVRVRGQVLRRTFNSIALAASVDRVLLQGMIGHSGDAMTGHYQGLRPEVAAGVAEEVWR